MDRSACPKPPIPVDRKCINLVRCYFVPIILSANQLRTDVKQVVDKECEWYWRGISIYAGDGSFSIRFSINDNYYLSNVRIPNTVAFGPGRQGSRSFVPELQVRPGGKIGIEIENLGASPISVAVFLLGVKRVAV